MEILSGVHNVVLRADLKTRRASTTHPSLVWQLKEIFPLLQPLTLLLLLLLLFLSGRVLDRLKMLRCFLLAELLSLIWFININRP